MRQVAIWMILFAVGCADTDDFGETINETDDFGERSVTETIDDRIVTDLDGNPIEVTYGTLPEIECPEDGETLIKGELIDLTDPSGASYHLDSRYPRALITITTKDDFFEYEGRTLPQTLAKGMFPFVTGPEGMRVTGSLAYQDFGEGLFYPDIEPEEAEALGREAWTTLEFDCQFTVEEMRASEGMVECHNGEHTIHFAYSFVEADC